MSSNILTHNREPFYVKINKDEYWDFHLSTDTTAVYESGISEDCLSTYIDINDPECVWFDDIKSKSQHTWSEYLNNNSILKHFGTTGVDNGFYHYDKTRITNAMFYEIFMHSILDMSEYDNRLKLTKVSGNNRIFDYPIDIVEEDGMMVAKANGGFYQGFFKLHGYDYQVLPHNLGDGWGVEVTLKKSDLERSAEREILNDKYPENKGIFFYMGLRAENKWWTSYDVEHEFKHKIEWYFDSDYIKDMFYNNADYESMIYYIKDDNPETWVDPDPYFSVEGYFKPNASNMAGKKYADAKYFSEEYVTYEGGVNLSYNTDGYFEVDRFIREEDFDMETEYGFKFSELNKFTVHNTDNKYIFFDHTDDGYTTKTWNPEEGDFVQVVIPKLPDIGNQFLLFHNGEGGYTTKTIHELYEKESQKYDVLADIYRNALALQIKDDGSIGFKYAICNADDEKNKVEVVSDYSFPGIIKDDEWYTIHVRFAPVTSKFININEHCEVHVPVTEKMKIFVFVNGKLVLVSHDLPMINFRALKDIKEKQQGVPYNISLGGGTQGLCDVVYINYMKTPEYILPLEENFGGSFIGFIKDFKFYDCEKEFDQIKNNFSAVNPLLSTESKPKIL